MLAIQQMADFKTNIDRSTKRKQRETKNDIGSLNANLASNGTESISILTFNILGSFPYLA